MSTKNDKYLVLRGKNKDIYFIQKRISKKAAELIGKDFIKKSLETKNIQEAIEKRDKILNELKDIELSDNPENVLMNSKFLDDYYKSSHEKDLNVPSKNDIYEKNAYNFRDFNDPSNNYNKNVLTKNVYNEDKVDKYGYFSFIDYSKLPKKDDILSFIDKITPITIVFLVLFVTSLV
ncbi:MAG: hypothetical protein CMD68_05240 [Gammaproteobacteria bacterium]|nr:hypothetical protein [Gammaproteobacteria bacterium]|tara:strand:+ start:414 stop:944 length:531 start_codon:yes stop_codon:yes gene_type:complete